MYIYIYKRMSCIYECMQYVCRYCNRADGPLQYALTQSAWFLTDILQYNTPPRIQLRLIRFVISYYVTYPHLPAIYCVIYDIWRVCCFRNIMLLVFY